MLQLPRRVAPWVLVIWLCLAACSVSTVCAVRHELASASESSDAEAGDELGNSKSIDYFSVPAFFITFRETIEAVVIISVLLRFLEKIERTDLKPAVWKGAFIGLFVAIAVGIGFIIGFYETGKAAFTGQTEYIVEAILMLAAALIITALSASMLKIAHMREKWERKLQTGMARAEAKGGDLRHAYMFWLPLTAVLREGIETIIFLAGATGSYEAKDIPIPGILGILVGLAIGWFIFRVGKEASLRKLLIASTVILLFIAAGLFSHGAHELQELELFGTWSPSYERNNMNTPSWDICDDANHNTNGFWAIMRALVGYTCNPTPVEIIAYLLYWVLALTFLSFKLHLACFSYRADRDDSASSKFRAGAAEEKDIEGAPVRPVVSA